MGVSKMVGLCQGKSHLKIDDEIGGSPMTQETIRNGMKWSFDMGLKGMDREFMG